MASPRLVLREKEQISLSLSAPALVNIDTVMGAH